MCVRELSKLRVRDGCGGGRQGGGWRSGRECTSKNKDPTQRCGENIHIYTYVCI